MPGRVLHSASPQYSSAILTGPNPQTGQFTGENGNPNLFQNRQAAAKGVSFLLPGGIRTAQRTSWAGFLW